MDAVFVLVGVGYDVGAVAVLGVQAFGMVPQRAAKFKDGWQITDLIWNGHAHYMGASD